MEKIFGNSAKCLRVTDGAGSAYIQTIHHNSVTRDDRLRAPRRSSHLSRSVTSRPESRFVHGDPGDRTANNRPLRTSYRSLDQLVVLPLIERSVLTTFTLCTPVSSSRLQPQEYALVHCRGLLAG